LIAQNTYRRWLTLCGSANNIRQRGARSARATLEAVILIYLSFCAVTLAPAQDAPWQYHQLADFNIIFENSIFDAQRNPTPTIEPIAENTTAPTPVPQYIELTGVVVGECSAAAFFNASNPDNSGIRLQGEEIAGFSLMDIQTYGVTLQNDNRRLMLPVGSRLNTQDTADEWQIEAMPYQPIYRQPLRAMQPSAQVNSQAAGQGAQGVPGARVRRMR